MDTIYLAWRDPGKRWFPVGRLTRDQQGIYHFVYTQGAIRASKEGGFLPLVQFPNIWERYSSPSLFATFENRLLSERRPEFKDFQSWLNLPPEQKDPLVLLARSNAHRETDTFEVFARPEPDSEGRFHVQCFVHGLHHREGDAIKRAETLVAGDPLHIEPDPENVADRLAIKALTTDAVPRHIGYLPRYLNMDVRQIGLDAVCAAVERVNPPPTPTQFRVLIRLWAPWPQGFAPCGDALYQPLPESRITRTGSGT